MEGVTTLKSVRTSTCLPRCIKSSTLYYVDDIEPNAFMQRGMDAMLEGLDPYTVFISEADIEDYRFQTTGRYGGIGCYVRQYNDYMVVAEVIQGYGAEEAGIQGGDRICSCRWNKCSRVYY